MNFVAPALSEADVADVATLFRAYAEGLGVDLSYQGFAAELAGLPGGYAPPAGALLLARDEAERAVGCVALRPLGGGACEMKRLYVSRAARGAGLGAALAKSACAEAARIGHRELRLDTLPEMKAAQALYRAMGFVETTPYYAGAPAGTIFLALPLTVAA